MQAQGKGAKNKKIPENCQKKPKTRLRSDYVKRTKNRLKTMKKGNSNGMARENKRKTRKTSGQ